MKHFRPKDLDAKISIVCFVIMLTITFVNVISRYILHMSLSFTEELVCALFVFLCTMGGAVAAKQGSHYTLDLVTSMLSPKNKKRMSVVSCALSIIACGVLVYTGILMVQQQYSIGGRSYALKVPEWIYGSFVPIGCGFMLYRFAGVIRKILKSGKEEVL